MRRSGYTLMEVVLALAIATLLLGALYVAVDVQLRFAQQGRQYVEQSTLSRNIFARMSADASGVIGLSDPNRFRTMAKTGASATPSSTANSSTLSNSPQGTAVTFTNASSVQVILLPYGVKGDANTLHLFVSQVPRELINAQLKQQESTSPAAGDLRRVSYWLIPGNGIDSGGLARQEVKLATADDSGAIDQGVLPPNVEVDPKYIMAPEVQTLQFQYYDGTEWLDEWDSTEFGTDGITPVGSPTAIRVTIGIAQPDRPSQLVKNYVHVIQVLTANGNTLQADSPATQNMGGGATP